jgi:hypothetical protein
MTGVIPRVGLFGGWTPTHDNDPCAGGHPGGHHMDGRYPTCGRCGRVMDLRPCGCPEHNSMGRAYCPRRVQLDRAEVAAMVRAGVTFESD